MLHFLLVPVALATITAADSGGHYTVGGLVGGLTCPQFLNIMATARQDGGLRSVAGSQDTAGLENYVAGFETGMNSQPNGVADIFASLGPESAEAALYAIEPWCAEHPEEKFGSGVVALARKLKKTAR